LKFSRFVLLLQRHTSSTGGTEREATLKELRFTYQSFLELLPAEIGFDPSEPNPTQPNPTQPNLG
jgi:hypothetical protein